MALSQISATQGGQVRPGGMSIEDGMTPTWADIQRRMPPMPPASEATGAPDPNLVPLAQRKPVNIPGLGEVDWGWTGSQWEPRVLDPSSKTMVVLKPGPNGEIVGNPVDYGKSGLGNALAELAPVAAVALGGPMLGGALAGLGGGAGLSAEMAATLAAEDATMGAGLAASGGQSLANAATAFTGGSALAPSAGKSLADLYAETQAAQDVTMGQGAAASGGQSLTDAATTFTGAGSGVSLADQFAATQEAQDVTMGQGAAASGGQSLTDAATAFTGAGTIASLAKPAAKAAANLAKPITEWGTEEWLSALGKAAPGLIGAYASSEQGNSLSDLAKQQTDAENARYNDLVAREEARFADLKAREDAAIARQRGDIEYGRTQTQPYRTKLSDLYANPDSFLTSNEVQKPVQMGSDIMSRSLSVSGNPIGSGNALQQLQSYSADQLFSRLGEEKNRLGTFGGMSGFTQSGASVPGTGSTLPGSATAGSNVGYTGGSNLSLASLGADKTVWGDIAGAASDVFKPQKSLVETLTELKRAGII